MKEDYPSTARKRTDPILIEALARISSINTEKANQYKRLLGRINSEATAHTKMLKIVRDFIREEHDFSLKFQNALLKPIFIAIEEERFASDLAPENQDLDSAMDESDLDNTSSEDLSDYSVSEEDLKYYAERAAHPPVLKQDLLDDFHRRQEELGGHIKPAFNRKIKAVQDDPIMEAININDTSEVRKLLANNAPLTGQVESYVQENYPLMYMQLGSQYQAERKILASIKVAKYADHIIKNENIQSFMTSEQRYITDPDFDIDLFAKRLSCAHSSENNILEKLAGVRAFGDFRKTIDKIITKIENPDEIIIDGSFKRARTGLLISK